MKMIIAIIKDSDSEAVTQTMTATGYKVTTIASTGGFLRSGFSTLLSGVEDDQLVKALDTIRSVFPSQSKNGEKRCTLFVLNVAEYHQY
ncbi:MAG: cyclic-di-AMP receptor [Chloroflexi bacterium]|nr:cyclic-di-AMP receptor [Chloroflexota bacterium]